MSARLETTLAGLTLQNPITVKLDLDGAGKSAFRTDRKSVV